MVVFTLFETVTNPRSGLRYLMAGSGTSYSIAGPKSRTIRTAVRVRSRIERAEAIEAELVPTATQADDR
ncbi:hypothetical protein ACFZBU_36945 [Embleya sp. NPDC008237]|uniref:hypothetical protein n=1 Tax=unclassified Embleya TaxID=2699296 RepID=UPI0036F06C7A